MDQTEPTRASNEVAASKRPRRLKVRPFALGVLLGAIVGMLGGLAYLVIARGDALPPLTTEAFEAAEERWREQRLADYDLEIHVWLSGSEPGHIHLEVRNGQPIAMTRNGLPTRPHTWEAWTIEGQFAVIRQELEFPADPKSAHGVSNPDQVALRARFDERLGFPRRFSREVIGRKRGARNESMEWEVVGLRRVSGQ